MKYLRLLLLPFSIIYGVIVIIRNWLYDTGMFKSREFDLPVISVGNLDVGGAGKSPMTEYLITLLKPGNKLATLSRGYGRTTKGFLIANAATTAAQIGDEPAQFNQKCPEVTVAVCEDRVAGIEQLQSEHDIIILDDAYQHRAVRPGLSILLFDYNKLQDLHLVLPAGNLREPFNGRWRSDIMVVTKCPPDIEFDDMNRAYYRIEPNNHQPVFFTSIVYQPLRDLQGNTVDFKIDAGTTVFLLTGIASPAPLLRHIKGITDKIIHHNYPDHHQFSLKNIAKLADEFAASASQKKVIITTEKDAQRLGVHDLANAVAQMPVWVLPIGTGFLNNGQQEFDQLLLNYVTEYTKHN